MSATSMQFFVRGVNHGSCRPIGSILRKLPALVFPPGLQSPEVSPWNTVDSSGHLGRTPGGSMGDLVHGSAGPTLDS